MQSYIIILSLMVVIMLYIFYEKGHKTTAVIITWVVWRTEEDRYISLFGVL